MESYLRARLELLRRSQNTDGGWGYFPGKQSWLEPTAYAALALHGDPASNRAWELLKSWQGSDGSLRPAQEVQVSSWGTALFVTLAAARAELSEPAHNALSWLLGTEGTESGWLSKLVVRVGLVAPDRNPNNKGWPWKPDTSSWVEPTSHALVALAKASRQFPSSDLNERVKLGRAQLMELQDVDGGWNYGNRTVLDVDLPSYPETTGIALMGLQHQKALEKPLERASEWLKGSVSPLARAWLTIAMRLHGAGSQIPEAPQAVPPDLQIAALEALASFDGNYKLLQTEEA